MDVEGAEMEDVEVEGCISRLKGWRWRLRGVYFEVKRWRLRGCSLRSNGRRWRLRGAVCG